MANLIERLAAGERMNKARHALAGSLEADFTGAMKDAGLTWDQRVAYSVARSLKAISDQLEEDARERRR